jgi:hypothetical protein
MHERTEALGSSEQFARLAREMEAVVAELSRPWIWRATNRSFGFRASISGRRLARAGAPQRLPVAVGFKQGHGHVPLLPSDALAYVGLLRQASIPDVQLRAGTGRQRPLGTDHAQRTPRHPVKQSGMPRAAAVSWAATAAGTGTTARSSDGAYRASVSIRDRPHQGPGFDVCRRPRAAADKRRGRACWAADAAGSDLGGADAKDELEQSPADQIRKKAQDYWCRHRRRRRRATHTQPYGCSRNYRRRPMFSV